MPTHDRIYERDLNIALSRPNLRSILREVVETFQCIGTIAPAYARSSDFTSLKRMRGYSQRATVPDDRC
jgi:hypothetical protein